MNITNNLENLFQTAEKFKSAYFFTPPQGANMRRSYEEFHSIPEFSWEEGGNAYTAEFRVECSCSHVYARGVYTRNGKSTTLTAIKNSYKRLCRK